MKHVLAPLADRHLKLDVDLLGNDMEIGMNSFLQRALLIRKVTLYSSLLKIDEVEPMMEKSKEIKDF